MRTRLTVYLSTIFLSALCWQALSYAPAYAGGNSGCVPSSSALSFDGAGCADALRILQFRPLTKEAASGSEAEERFAFNNFAFNWARVPSSSKTLQAVRLIEHPLICLRFEVVRHGDIRPPDAVLPGVLDVEVPEPRSPPLA